MQVGCSSLGAAHKQPLYLKGDELRLRNATQGRLCHRKQKFNWLGALMHRLTLSSW